MIFNHILFMVHVMVVQNQLESLLDPLNEYTTLSTYFVTQKYHVLNNTNIDTHFQTRERTGQLLTFVPRLRTDSNVGSVARHTVFVYF